jgi:acetyl-CoA carboxylase carboxyl transferase subunit alpha
VTLARHPQRPRTLDFVSRLCDPFVELHGDRQFRDDRAIVGGLATFRGHAVLILGHQKGRDTRENLERNFGMVRPEGFRKALRLMRHAAKFGMPILTFVDTPGADPGPTSEEQGQAIAIAECIAELCEVPTPVISVVIGEGGSGGALAIGVADRVIMLENAIYSVASPEASATILWKDSGQAPAAAQAMKITAGDLLQFGLIDEVVPEPTPAHDAPDDVVVATGDAIERRLIELTELNRGATGLKTLLDTRRSKYRAIGAWRSVPAPTPIANQDGNVSTPE